MSTSDLTPVLDLFLTARRWTDHVKELTDTAEEEVQLIRDLDKHEMLNLSGQLLLGLEVRLYGVRAATRSAMDAIELAEKELRKAAAANADIEIAAKLDDELDDLCDKASGDAEIALSAAKARIEEAREAYHVAKMRLEDLKIPRLTAE